MAAGSAKSQCAVIGCPGQAGQTSPAAWLHTVKMKSIGSAAGLVNSVQLLLRKPLTSKCRSLKDVERHGVHAPPRMSARAERVESAARGD